MKVIFKESKSLQIVENCALASKEGIPCVHEAFQNFSKLTLKNEKPRFLKRRSSNLDSSCGKSILLLVTISALSLPRLLSISNISLSQTEVSVPFVDAVG